MAQRFGIEIGGVAVTAVMRTDEAPNLCKRFAEILPYQGFSVHAKFAGQELIIMVPYYADAENETFDIRPGDIGYYPGRQTVCIFYGGVTPFGKVSMFARLEHPEALMPAGDQILRDGVLPIRFIPL